MFHSDRQTNMTKLIVAFRNFANASKNSPRNSPILPVKSELDGGGWSSPRPGLLNPKKKTVTVRVEYASFCSVWQSNKTGPILAAILLNYPGPTNSELSN